VFDVVCVGNLCGKNLACLWVERWDVVRIVQNDRRGFLVSFGCFLNKNVSW
jgi:hypothetical protein